MAEPLLIRTLYRASMAGVQVRLIVRGICSLRPGVPGISDHIEVHSVIGRFLEHSRVYYFENGGHPDVFLASADFLARNMFRRVEACFPVENRKLADRIIADLELYLKDNTQAWLMNADGSYHKPVNSGELNISAQSALLEQHRKS